MPSVRLLGARHYDEERFIVLVLGAPAACRHAAFGSLLSAVCRSRQRTAESRMPHTGETPALRRLEPPNSIVQIISAVAAGVLLLFRFLRLRVFDLAHLVEEL